MTQIKPYFFTRLNHVPIRKKLTVIIVGICVATFIGTSLIQMGYNLYNERNLLEDRLSVTAQVIALQSVAALEFSDPVAAEENLNSLSVQPDISKACIYNGAGEVFVFYAPDNKTIQEKQLLCPAINAINTGFSWSVLNILVDVAAENMPVIGKLYMEYGLADMYRNMARVWLFNFTLMGGAIVLAYLISNSLQQLISRPILSLAESTRQFARFHDYGIRAVKYTDDELGELVDDFNVMVEELEKHETQLEEAIEDLTTSNMELERFAYICSHDLQEPLRMISNYTQLLASRYEERLDEEAHEYMNYIIDGAARMRELINDILAYSRLSHFTDPPTMVNLQDVIKIVMKDLALAIEEKSAVIEIDPMPTIRGYKGLLVQIFLNLINNALKFCKDKPPEVRVKVTRLNQAWQFSVQDNGIGIDPLYHDKVFEIFKRLNRREEYSGTGIGLAICKKAVEFHGGRIWIESTLGEGSTFHFTIPDKIERKEKQHDKFL